MTGSNDKIGKLLEEILKWQRLQGIKILRETLPQLLDTKEKRIVYEMTDGKNNQSKIASEAKVATGTVSNWWNLWYSYGILIKEGKGKGRYKKIISLKDLGIPIKPKSSGEKNDHPSRTDKQG